MNVVMVWTGFNLSSVEKHHLMANGLEVSGVHTYTIGFSDDADKREYFEKTYAHDAMYKYEYGSRRSLFQGRNYVVKIANNIYLSARFFYRLYKQLRKKNIDAIIAPTQPLEVTFPIVLLAKVFKVGVVPNVMEYYPAMPSFRKKRNVLSRWSWALIIRYADAYIVISRFLEEKIKNISKKPVFKLPAILPKERKSHIDAHMINGFIGRSKQGSILSPSHLLLYTSSKEYGDLLDFCIESLAKIKEEDFRLVITGIYSEDLRDKWLSKASALGLDGKVAFSGFLSEEDLYDLQLQSDALLIPLLDNERHRARFPQKVLGYMRLCRPVVTTNVGELGEYFTDGETIIMDRSITADGYSRKIKMVLAGGDEIVEISNRCKDYVEEQFGMEYWGRKLKNFLSGLN